MTLFEIKLPNSPEVQMVMAKDIAHLLERLTLHTQCCIMKSYELPPTWDSKHFTLIK